MRVGVVKYYICGERSQYHCNTVRLDTVSHCLPPPPARYLNKKIVTLMFISSFVKENQSHIYSAHMATIGQGAWNPLHWCKDRFEERGCGCWLSSSFTDIYLSAVSVIRACLSKKLRSRFTICWNQIASTVEVMKTNNHHEFMSSNRIK